MSHSYEVGTRAWQPDPTEGWVASELKEKQVDGDKVLLVFELENGDVDSPRFPFLCLPSSANILPRKNPCKPPRRLFKLKMTHLFPR